MAVCDVPCSRKRMRPRGEAAEGLMRNTFLLFIAAALALQVMGCGGKKNDGQAEAEQKDKEFILGSCSTYKVKVSPQKVERPDCTIESDCVVHLEATAYDREGNLRPVPLHWRFRRPDADSDKKAGTGHELVVKTEKEAVFKSSGIAPGTFTVLAQDRTCNMGSDEEPQYPEGQAWIKVYNPPDRDAACGRMRVTYGDKVDHLGDVLLSSAKSLLMAEVSSDRDLGFRYRVRFYINGKPYPLNRPLYKEEEVPLAPGMTQGYKALLPVYITPGNYTARYELLKRGQVICGSRLISFSGR